MVVVGVKRAMIGERRVKLDRGLVSVAEGAEGTRGVVADGIVRMMGVINQDVVK